MSSKQMFSRTLMWLNSARSCQITETPRLRAPVGEIDRTVSPNSSNSSAFCGW